jgi:phosphoglycerate dehydrogenase-like enzyme
MPHTFTVLFADPRPPSDMAWIAALPAAAGLRLLAPATDDPAELAALLPEADAIVTQYRSIDAATLAAAPRLRLVQRYGTRPDGVDLAAAQAAGVQVATMPLRGCIAVAELAITLILALSKSLVRAHQLTVAGAYRDLGLTPVRTDQRTIAFQWMKLPGLLEVSGRALGVVGLGEIGTEAARRAQACGMEVRYTKRRRLHPEVERQERLTFAPLDELLAESDFVLLSTPHTPETDRLIGARELALMKPSAFLVNICRGGVVDEAALVEALQARRIAGAGLDVFVHEPVPYDHPLLACDNVILTPHIGGGTGGARDKQMGDVLANVTSFAAGEAPRHLVR